MKITDYKRKILFLALITAAFSFPVTVAAESFRVRKTHSVEISSESYSEAIEKVGINDAIAIFLPKDKTFVEGLEIKMDIPSEVASWPDCVACSIYNAISPYPTTSKIDYTGTRFYVSTLPGRLSWILQIPLREDNSIKSNNYTKKTDVMNNLSKDVVFMRFQPIMKGVPEETLAASITLTVKPILTDKGYLDLKLNTTESNLEPCTVYIDDNTVTEGNSKLLLSTGIHNISIISESYRNEMRTVRIEQAKTTELTVDMKSIQPTLFITAPEGTLIFLDDQPCQTLGAEFTITEGEHKVRFSVGDYEITRTITALKGKTYTANFSVDLQITEE